MLIVCPNCATSYGVEMASLRLASGWTRKLRCKARSAMAQRRAPRYRLCALRSDNAAHQEIYSWTAAPARGRLSAGHKLTFRSELTLPPPDTRDVVVRFIDRENTL